MLAATAALPVACAADGASDTAPPRTPQGAVSGAPAGPTTWLDLLDGAGSGEPLLVACQDRNADGRLDAADGYEGLSIPLADGPAACAEAGVHAEYWAGDAAVDCSGPPSLLVVLVGGGGTNLLDTSLGESIGMVEIANELRRRADDAGVATAPLLTAAAITGADLPQTRMEQWLAYDLSRRLDETPCLRAAVIGHSHGGVTVTSVLAAIEDAYPGRLYGVLLDRSTALYDRPAGEFPADAPVLNVFQENEGWHGVPLAMPNVEDLDQSAALPAWPLAAGEQGPPAPPVTHLNLDDAPGVRGEIVERILRWATASP